MSLKHTDHGNDPCGVFSLQEEIKVVQNGSEIRTKAHNFVGDLGQVILAAVIDKPSLSQSLNIGQLEAFKAITAGEQVSFQDVGIVFFADGADIDVQWPIVFLENSNDFLLSFIGRDVECVFRLLRRRSELLREQFTS